MTDYHPIDCDQHSVLELLAMRQRTVRVAYHDADGAAQLAEGAVVDVLTRAGAEYLELETATTRVSIRLDHLDEIYDRSGRVFPVGSGPAG